MTLALRLKFPGMLTCQQVWLLYRGVGFSAVTSDNAIGFVSGNLSIGAAVPTFAASDKVSNSLSQHPSLRLGQTAFQSSIDSADVLTT